MASASPKVRVITRSERVRARRGRTAVILDSVLAELKPVTMDGENGAVVTSFGSVDDKTKRGAIAGKIKTHWKALHGENAPKLEIDWIPGENLPQVFVKA